MKIAVRLGNRSQLIIPKMMRECLGIGPGKEVILEVHDSAIMVRARPDNYTRYMSGLGKDVWAGTEPTEYVRKEREAWEGKE
jgi:bifunctional DNA-binding transcriptional regulator/antitoxin component of YhaV-PrlF toxin-antitoxin module